MEVGGTIEKISVGGRLFKAGGGEITDPKELQDFKEWSESEATLHKNGVRSAQMREVLELAKSLNDNLINTVSPHGGVGELFDAYAAIDESTALFEKLTKLLEEIQNDRN